ncbi:MAG: NUDIX hydrolase [Gammaproteobacteria bacterium]|jgi:8-oxo-dGTP pyrophosphatase MutT (NUDIX family)|nr:MAG: NUDIX hydrolase [Gammaproteobacteria bacterium]
MATLGAFAIIFDEQRRVLCVRTAYGARRWTNPGGRIEANESPLAALTREVLEETGYVIEPGELIGVYAKPYEDDLTLAFTARIIERRPWTSDDEIEEATFFPVAALPGPMTNAARARIEDGAAGRRGIYRVFATAAEGNGIPTQTGKTGS